MTMAENRSLDQVTSGLPDIVQVGVDGGTRLYAGSFAAPLTATGMLAVGGGVASTNAVMGVASAEANNTSGADGALSVNLAQGVFRRKNSATSACVAATVGKVVYAEDGETVRIASGATYPVAGVFLGFEADGTTPLVFVSAVLNYLLAQGTLSSNLAAITNGLGASLIGIEDAGGFTSAADVEAALAELYQALISVQGTVDIPIQTFVDVAGTQLTTFADGASDQPGIELTESEGFGIRWNNHAAPLAVMSSFRIPADADITANMTVHVIAAKVGATVGDAVTWDIACFGQVVGATYIADADFGGTSSAMTGDATTKTIQDETLTLALADLPAVNSNVTMTLKPTAGTLGTDDVIVFAVRVNYTKKLLTS